MLESIKRNNTSDTGKIFTESFSKKTQESEEVIHNTNN